MADIFISYKKEDAGRVIRLVEALRAEGFSVWWDHGIQAGSQWDRTIRQELDSARVVIAVWSASSVDAPWVKEEATVGKNRGILLPVRIDDVEPPLGFTLIQAADLVGWRGDPGDRRWQFFLQSLKAVLDGKPVAGFEAPLKTRPPARRSGLALPLAAGGGLLAVALAGIVAWAVLLRGPAVETPPAAAPLAAPAATPAPPPTQVAVPAPLPPPARPQPSAAEQQLWDRAMADKNRQGFQTYLIAYPDGAYAQRARDILLTCRTETREEWRPGPAVASQIVRGVGDTGSGMTPVEACTKAKSEVHTRAQMMCETIVHNGGFRNARWTVTDRACDCNRTSPVVIVCIADLPYSCMWEQKMTERIELCG